MEENKTTIGSNSIYRTITDAILDDISQYKSTQVNDGFNEKTFLNIFSLINLFEEKEHEEKPKDLNCFFLLNSNGPSHKGINAPKDINQNDINGLDDNTQCKERNDNENRDEDRRIDTIWGDDPSFSIRDKFSNNVFDNDSKIIRPSDFNLSNQSNIFGDALKEIGNNEKGINPNSNINTNMNCKSIENENNDDDDDFLIFKKEDLIITKPISKKHKEGIATNNNISNTNDNKKPEVNHSLFSDSNNNSQSHSNTVNTNNNSDNKPSNFKSKSLIQSESITSFDPNIKVKKAIKSPNSSHLLLPTKDQLNQKVSHLNKTYPLSRKTISYYISNMSDSYLYYMNGLYTDIKQKAKHRIALSNDIDQLLFINLFKSFILKIGISEKNFYHDCVRNLVYQRDNFTLELFISCFNPIFGYKLKDGLVKYKCKFSY